MSNYTVSQISNNIYQVDMTPTFTDADVLAALGEVFLAAGWVVDNDFGYSDAYKVLNADGVTYKRVQLRTSTSPGTAADGQTDQRTLLLYTYNDDNVGITLSSRTSWYENHPAVRLGQFYVVNHIMQFLVFISQYWVIVYSHNITQNWWGGRRAIYMSSVDGSVAQCYFTDFTFTGVIEHTRWHSQDSPSTNKNPFVWLNSDMLVGALPRVGKTAYITRLEYMNCPIGGVTPVTKNGTQEQDQAHNMIITSFGSLQYPDRPFHYLPSEREKWSNKNWVSNIFFVADIDTDSPDYRGHFIGLKIVQLDTGAEMLDKVTIPCNSDFLFDPNGTPVVHRIIRTGREVLMGSYSNNTWYLDDAIPRQLTPLVYYAIPE